MLNLESSLASLKEICFKIPIALVNEAWPLRRRTESQQSTWSTLQEFTLNSQAFFDTRVALYVLKFPWGQLERWQEYSPTSVRCGYRQHPGHPPTCSALLCHQNFLILTYLLKNQAKQKDLHQSKRPPSSGFLSQCLLKTLAAGLGASDMFVFSSASQVLSS